MIQINESMYPYDTLKQVLHKIAIYCYKHINGNGLFAWYKNNKREIHPFHLDPSLPIKNPFIETTYDPLYVTSQNQKKFVAPYRSFTIHIDELDIPYAVKSCKNIHVISIEDYHTFSQQKAFYKKITEDQYLYGILQKYWPFIESIESISSQDRENIDKQLQDNHTYEELLKTYQYKLPCKSLENRNYNI